MFKTNNYPTYWGKDMDSEALFNSDVFRNLINIELKREADEKIKKETIEKNALNNFLELQKKINANPILKNQFKKLQQRFINEPDNKDVNQDFVSGVLLLKFED